jgi:DNA primase
MKIKGVKFGQSIKYVHEVLGLKYSRNKKTKKEIKDCPLEIFRKVKRKKYTANHDEMPLYDETIIREYVPLVHIDWAREGVMPFAAKRFNIGYSLDRKRIVIPERLWCGGDNDYIGIAGRTTVENYQMLDIPKFYKLSASYPKGMNVYGLNENYESIQKAGVAVVLEAQKSVLKRYSRKDEKCVSIGGCELTDEQVKILISLNVDIVICFDEGIDINHIRKECDKFYSIRNVAYMYDRWGLIKKGSKDSPADMPNKIWEFIYKHRTVYNEQERKEFKKWQEKQRKN